jgi:hypothetical protein
MRAEWRVAPDAWLVTTGECLQPQDSGTEDGVQQGSRTGGEIAQGKQAQLLKLAQELGGNIRQPGHGQWRERRRFRAGG